MIQANRLTPAPPTLEQEIGHLTAAVARLTGAVSALERRLVTLPATVPPSSRRVTTLDAARELCPLWFTRANEAAPRGETARRLEEALNRLRRRLGAQVLGQLRGDGYRLWLENGTLRVNGQRMTEAAAALVARHQEALLLAVAQEQ